MTEQVTTAIQAISILKKMEVEQRTLSGLWGQFTVAISQLSEVLTFYDEINKAVPMLIEQKNYVEREIEGLTKKLESAKVQATTEEAEFRASLEKELEPLRKAVTEARQRAVDAENDAATAEKNAAERRATLEKQIKGYEGRLEQARQALADFKKKHDL